MSIIGKVLHTTSDKIIIVSRWIFMLSIIGKYLREDYIKYAELTGIISIKKRDSIVYKFNHINEERVSIHLACIKSKANSNKKTLIGALEVYIIHAILLHIYAIYDS